MWSDTPGEHASSPVALTAGKHEIRVQYYENGGGATARLRYESTDAGVAKQVIPVSKLSPPTAATALRAPQSLTVSSIVGDSIVLTWVDHTGAETGYRIERSTDGTNFTAVGTVPANQSIFIDSSNVVYDGGTTNYYYRVVALGANGQTQTSEVSGSVYAAGAAGGAITQPNFADISKWQLNGTAVQVDADGDGINDRLRLTDNVNGQNGSAYLLDPRHVSEGFQTSFDFVIGEGGAQSGNPADGFTFIIQAAETIGFATGPFALGAAGGGLSYSGIGNSIAIKFDLYNNINQTGLYFNGEGISDDPAFARNRVLPAHIDLNGGAPLRVSLAYNPTTKVLTQTVDDIGNAATAPFTTSYNVDIPAIIGSNTAYVGFGGATGGENARQDILNFAFDPTAPANNPAIAEVYVSGSTWAQAFRDYVQSSGFGTSAYGYKLAAVPTNLDTVSWTNVNQIVLRYAGPIGAAGVPTAGTVLVDGVRTDYTVTGVETLDDRTVRLTLDRPLGNVVGGGIVGDRVRLTVPGAGQNGANFVQQINVLQGDANREGNGRVTSNDAGYVKSRLNRSTTSPTSPTQSSYTIFADVDASGRINSNDQGAVKSRLNDNMPALAASAELVGVASISDEMFSSAAVL
jgi:hypothetical protein